MYFWVFFILKPDNKVSGSIVIVWYERWGASA